MSLANPFDERLAINSAEKRVVDCRSRKCYSRAQSVECVSAQLELFVLVMQTWPVVIKEGYSLMATKSHVER
jgi:hypothetical protein